MEQYNSIQQILKKGNGHDRNPIYPSTVIQAVFDAKTGASLEAILAQFNSIYVQYQGSPQATRNIIPVEMRRAGLMITYMNMDSETITEKASSAVQKDNDHWGLEVNWSRVDELSLSGDIAVSVNGTWIINGVDTKVPARGSKGDAGLTPWLKTIDNKLHYSYDNTTWEPCSDYLAGYFRFNATSSDSQAGTIGKIQISRDNKTWQDLSPEFRNYLRIQGYVSSTSALPKNQVVGTIYGVNEGTNTYSLHVWDGSTWVNNGTFTSIAAGVVQETGDSETEVMSQKAVTEKLSELDQEQANLYNNLFIPNVYSLDNVEYGNEIGYSITSKGIKHINDNYSVSTPIELKRGCTIYAKLVNNAAAAISVTDINNSNYDVKVIGSTDDSKIYIYTAEKDCYIVLSWKHSIGEPEYVKVQNVNLNNSLHYVNPPIYIRGNDSEPSTIKYYGLTKGRLYRIYIHTPKVEFDKTLGFGSFRFVVNTINKNEENVSDIVRIGETELEELNPYYDFEMPDDGTDSIRIGVRCKKDEPFVFHIEDITSLIPTQYNINDTYGILNITQIKYGYYLYGENSEEIINNSYFITPYIPLSNKDEITVYCGFTSSGVRFASYDSEKNLLGAYTNNSDPRTVYFSNENVTYARFSFRIDNIGSYVKVNGVKVFEWTKNLYDLYTKYNKIEKIQEGPLYRNYILCSGREVNSPCIINEILPNHYYRIYLKDTNPPSEGYADVSMYKFSIRSYNEQNIHTSLLTVNYEHEWKEYYDIKTPSDAKYLYLRARCENNYRFYFYIEDITYSGSGSSFSSTSILATNPVEEFTSKFQSAKKRYYTSTDTTRKHPIVIAHLSDIHTNWVNVERFIEFTNYWKDYIDILVNTGDNPINKYTEGFDGYTSIKGVENIINVIGNHDTRGDNGWQDHVGIDSYNALIKPFVSNWEVVQPVDAETNGYCYFYKDYTDNLLRIIFVDIMAYDETEDSWLESVLSEARSKNYDVLIATHFSGAKPDNSPVFVKIPCNYTSLFEFAGEDSSEGLNSYNNKAYLLTTTVQKHIDNGGAFCGYFQGHYHADFVAKVANYPQQMIYSIGGTKAGEVRDYNHIVGTRSQDEFQIISIDTYLKIVKLFKVGANVDLYGRHKNSICINYQTGEIVAESY